MLSFICSFLLLTIWYVNDKYYHFEKVPADARILSLLTSSLSVDEGSLTGESVTVQKITGDEAAMILATKTSSLLSSTPNETTKSNASPIPLQDQLGTVFSGSMISSGIADAVIIRTGMSTEIGKVCVNNEYDIPIVLFFLNTVHLGFI